MTKRYKSQESEAGRLRQKKSLGQVFLTVEWPVERMVEILREWQVTRVLEIGPGAGILTRALVEAGFQVTAVEKDERFAERMQDFARVLSYSTSTTGRLEVVQADILNFNWLEWVKSGSGKAAIVGNIPYNISSPILMQGLPILDELAGLAFMTQKEFAERLAAKHGTKDYGSLTVFAQLRADVALRFEVARNLFRPVPKVDSAVVTLTAKSEKPDVRTLSQVETLTRAAFSQRRKKLRNSLRQFLEGQEEGGNAQVPIDLERRADALSPQEFVMLAEHFFQRTL